MQIPPDSDVLLQATALRDDTPSLGIPRLYALLKARNPSWSLSEKRFRKILAPKSPIPQTGQDDALDLPPKVEVKLFAGGKGKGLVATESMKEGEIIFEEDPWIATADADLHPLLQAGRMCTHCLFLFDMPYPPLSVSCPKCSARFCNRLCLSKARNSGSHPEVLCPGWNPSAAPLLAYITSEGARHLDAVARIFALNDTATLKRAQTVMARMSIQDIESQRREWSMVGEQRITDWKIGHQLLVSALEHRRPPIPSPSFETFLELLGMASLNQESSGGIYALHAHLNHSCEPNARVRNLPKANAARGCNRITVLARHDIAKGEELCIPYVNFALSRDERREDLRSRYGFWCECGKCKRGD